MKVTHLVLTGGMVLLLSGCSTLSRMAPWNWFGSSLTVSEQGVGGVTGDTTMDDAAIADGLNGDYRLVRGMRIVAGQPVSYYEAFRDDKTALLFNGENGKVSRIEVLDKDIETDNGVKIGTPFSELYSKAFGACQPGVGLDAQIVECKAPQSQHLNYQFSGEWRGPEGLIPPDDTLKNWTLTKIVWHR